MKSCIIIPARIGSTRLPNKLLLKLGDKTVIERTYIQCKKTIADSVFVATDSVDIKNVIESIGGDVIMTSTSCLTGTDRVAEAVIWNHLDYDIFINVQGDEPIINFNHINTLINVKKENIDKNITCVTKIKTTEELESNSTVKVIFMGDTLRYCSRSPIPLSKDNQLINAYKHYAIYAFNKKDLITFYNRGITEGKTKYEQIEDIEILRFLELNLDFKVLELQTEFHKSLDTEKDYEEIKGHLKKL